VQEQSLLKIQNKIVFIYMGKKIILTEEQLKRISSLINEDFDSHIYDLILDKYNEVGLEGMAQDEIDYLKSGGETDIPESFREPERQSFVEGGEGDDEVMARELMELSEAQGYRLIKSENVPEKFAIRLQFTEEIYEEVLRIFGGMEYRDSMGKLVKVDVDDQKTKISVVLPMSWYDLMFNEDSEV
jgi:hypothetical protein